MRNYSIKNDSYLIDIWFMVSKELRVFGISYLCLFFIIFFLGIIIAFFINDYEGYLPFSKTMIMASPSVRLMNDIVISYATISFNLMFFKWFFVGFSRRLGLEFKRYEKWFWENRADFLTDGQLNNRKNGLLVVSIILIVLIPFMWIHTFGFDDGGNSPKMQITLSQTHDFVLFCYMVISYLAGLFTIVFSITNMELRKYVL